MKIVGIAGSLRSGSYNRLILQAADDLSTDVSIDIVDLSDIPLYNDDVYRLGFPKAVEDLREQIAQADALIIATPEYNHSVPGVLKNAIDWVSRPPDQPLSGKPVAILGAAPGRLGTVRAQAHLRQILTGLNALVLPKPEVYIANVRDVISEDGKFTNDRTAEFVQKLLNELREWTARFSSTVLA